MEDVRQENLQNPLSAALVFMLFAGFFTGNIVYLCLDTITSHDIYRFQGLPNIIFSFIGILAYVSYKMPFRRRKSFPE